MLYSRSLYHSIARQPRCCIKALQLKHARPSVRLLLESIVLSVLTGCERGCGVSAREADWGIAHSTKSCEETATMFWGSSRRQGIMHCTV